ncbi:MAG TPA: phosphomethylpyrimidine synthase, partial [Verrucomicrobiae bacterium]
MIATRDSFEPHSSEQLPMSRRVYVQGILHPDVRVPMREIQLTPTKSITGRLEINEPVRVYDTSGPWGDPDFNGTVAQGLPTLRRKWILTRGDVEEVDGRPLQPIDDGYLSKTPLDHPQRKPNSSFAIRHSSFAKRRPLRAKPGKVVTQLQYARAGIITPEMEFIAIRENMGISHLKSQISNLADDIVR